MDSNQSKKGGSAKSPCQTPRSTDKSNRDLRSADSNSNSNPFSKNEKEKGVNIQVIVRCRYISKTALCFLLFSGLMFTLVGFVISDLLIRRRRGYKRLRFLLAMTGKRKWL